MSTTTFASYLIEVWLRSIIPDLASTLEALDLSPTRGCGAISSIPVWIPAPIICGAALDLVNTFHSALGKPRITTTECYMPVSA